MSALTVNESVYEGIEDKDVVGKLKYQAIEVGKALNTTTTGFLSACEHIHTAHKLLAGIGCEGKFRPWVQSIGISSSTAYNYVRVWESFGKAKNVTQFEPTALIRLSQASVPDIVRKEAIKVAGKRRLDGKVATKLITTHIEKVVDGDAQVHNGHKNFKGIAKDEAKDATSVEPLPLTTITTKKEPDIKSGEACVCGNTHWLLTDAGRRCTECGISEDELPAAKPVEVKAPEVVKSMTADAEMLKKANRALGQLVRAIDSLGHYKYFESALKDITLRLGSIKPEGTKNGK